MSEVHRKSRKGLEGSGAAEAGHRGPDAEESKLTLSYGYMGASGGLRMVELVGQMRKPRFRESSTICQMTPSNKGHEAGPRVRGVRMG